ncbi:MAG: SWIM zinc finger family protein [Chloroflexi bacterium]|nr:SWIM zinc finger family protein [Chloroflexota bacterium]
MKAHAPLPKITLSMIHAGAEPQSFQRGEAYYEDGAISNTSLRGNVLMGDCAGTSAPYYRVQVMLDEAGIEDATCTCPYEFGGYCKHIVALLLTYVHHPKRFAVRKEPDELLADLSRDDLAALLTNLLRERPELYDRVEAALAVPATKGKAAKTKRKKVDADIYRRQIAGIMHSLDGMRMSEAYWHVGGLANELRQVVDSAMKFLDAGDADTALAILLTLLEESSRGIEYLDDSNGELGDFVGELGQPLAEAVLSLDLSAVERTKLADKLTKLVNYAASYGMDGNLHIAIQAAKRGWDDFPSDTTSKHRAADEDEYDDEWDDESEDDDWEDEEGEYEANDGGWPGSPPRGDLTEAKLNVLQRQGRTDEYLAVCQKANRHLRYAIKLCELKRLPEAMKYAGKHLEFADEAQQMAEQLRASKHIDEAIEIGERGLKLKGSKVRLGEWLGPVEEAQGRNKQALEAWLAAFPENPSLEKYKTIKQLAGTRWAKLRDEVIQQTRKGYNTQVLAEVFLFEEEWDEAIKVAEGRDVWYPVVEAVADGVIEHRPEWVARAGVKHAERLMTEPKSKNYPFAAGWLKRAKKAYQHLGQTQEWKSYLQKLKEKYSRRPALMSHLKRL